MEYHSIRQLEELCKTEQKPVWKIVLKAEQTETDETEKQIFERMRQMYHEMKAADEGYAAELRSASGMAGGDGEKMHRFNVTGKNLCSGYMALAMEKALKMGESNACMKRIVAAPTAGSCGVIPAVLISYEEVVAESEESGDDPAEDRMVQALFTAAGIGKEYEASEETMIQAMYVAAGIGQVIANRASLAGASGGCQAEIGTAAAMAAGALTFLQGGTTRQIMQAAAFALKNMLGLTCDPVGGLVEVPCIKRNVAGVVNAISAAQLAMAGIVSAISPDDTIDSMRRIGNELPVCLKETGMGGLAVTESAKKIMKKMLNVTEMLKID